jgi:adenylyltransferase/sulfurtransferase
MLRADIKDNGEPYELTLFTDGRAIVKGTKEANTARSIYAKYVGA